MKFRRALGLTLLVAVVGVVAVGSRPVAAVEETDPTCVAQCDVVLNRASALCGGQGTDCLEQAEQMWQTCRFQCSHPVVSKKLTMRKKKLLGGNLCTSTCESHYRICVSRYCTDGDKSCEGTCWHSYQSCQTECAYAPHHTAVDATTEVARPSAAFEEPVAAAAALGNPEDHDSACVYACLADWAQCVGACRSGDAACYATCKATDVNVCIPQCPPAPVPPPTSSLTMRPVGY